MAFQKAVKQQAKVRVALHGGSGAGKTYTALRIAQHFGRIAVIDTESGSASKYAKRTPEDKEGFDFDVVEVSGRYEPRAAIALIKESAADHDVVILDSAYHFWKGPGGFLAMVDEEVERQKAKGWKPDTFAAWKAVDALYQEFVQAIITSPIHVFVTLRAKMAYEKSDGGDGGKKGSVRKIGLEPEFREGFQYEFDVEGMLNIEHTLSIGKTRCPALDGKWFKQPGKEVADILKEWAAEGIERPVLLPRGIVKNGKPQESAAAATDQAGPDPWAGAVEQAEALIDTCENRAAVDAIVPKLAELLPSNTAPQVARKRVNDRLVKRIASFAAEQKSA